MEAVGAIALAEATVGTIAADTEGIAGLAVSDSLETVQAAVPL